MTDQKHTKELWRILQKNSYFLILSGPDDDSVNILPSMSNCYLDKASRAIECVNACADIENPLDLAKQLSEVTKQRDDAIKLCSDLIAENAGLKNSRDELRDELTKMKTFMSKLNLPEKDFMKWTETLDEHPEEYDGPCNCYLCLSYANY